MFTCGSHEAKNDGENLRQGGAVCHAQERKTLRARGSHEAGAFMRAQGALLFEKPGCLKSLKTVLLEKRRHAA
jgi:hypothetical protein